MDTKKSFSFEKDAEIKDGEDGSLFDGSCFSGNLFLDSGMSNIHLFRGNLIDFSTLMFQF